MEERKFTFVRLCVILLLLGSHGGGFLSVYLTRGDLHLLLKLLKEIFSAYVVAFFYCIIAGAFYSGYFRNSLKHYFIIVQAGTIITGGIIGTILLVDEGAKLIYLAGGMVFAIPLTVPLYYLFQRIPSGKIEDLYERDNSIDLEHLEHYYYLVRNPLMAGLLGAPLGGLVGLYLTTGNIRLTMSIFLFILCIYLFLSVITGAVALIEKFIIPHVSLAYSLTVSFYGTLILGTFLSVILLLLDRGTAIAPYIIAGIAGSVLGAIMYDYFERKKYGFNPPSVRYIFIEDDSFE